MKFKLDDGIGLMSFGFTVALGICCANHYWGGVAFWGISDLELAVSIASLRIEHAIL